MRKADFVGVGLSSLELHTVDGLTLAAQILPATGVAVAMVVLVHGLAASKDDAEVSRTASALARHGFDVLSYDARGHAESGGLCTLGDDERHDVAAAVDEAHRRADRVLIVGASMGAVAAIRHVSEHPNVDGLVTISCPSAWRIPRNARTLFASGLTQTRLGRWAARRALNVRLAAGWTGAASPSELAPTVKIPWALVHGRDDRFVKHHNASELHAAAGQRGRLDIVTGMAHAFDVVGIPAIVRGAQWTLSEQLAAR